jgi:hypothetical protein
MHLHGSESRNSGVDVDHLRLKSVAGGFGIYLSSARRRAPTLAGRMVSAKASPRSSLAPS